MNHSNNPVMRQQWTLSDCADSFLFESDIGLTSRRLTQDVPNAPHLDIDSDPLQDYNTILRSS